MVALDLEDLQICLEIGNLGMIGFMMITFLNPVYDGKLFKRWYKMSKTLFFRIMDTLVAHDVYFSYRRNIVDV